MTIDEGHGQRQARGLCDMGFRFENLSHARFRISQEVNLVKSVLILRVVNSFESQQAFQQIIKRPLIILMKRLLKYNWIEPQGLGSMGPGAWHYVGACPFEGSSV